MKIDRLPCGCYCYNIGTKIERGRRTTNHYTTEQLVLRMEDMRAIRNLMGRMTQEMMYKGEGSFFAAFWSTEREDVSLGVNDGWYLGPEAIGAYYEAIAKRTELSDAVMKKRFPTLAPEGYGIGQMDLKPLSSDLVEVAGDGETAKGLWAVQGSDCRIGVEGPLSYWTIGIYAADFRKENGQWRLWHLLDLRDIDHPCGEKWWLPRRERPVEAGFEDMARASLPAPSIPAALHTLWTPERVGGRMPECPQPYEHFAETFSYGYEEVR